MTYTYHSQTSSGWEITTDPTATPDKRWRITHPIFGEKFFPAREVDGRNVILEFTVGHMLEQFNKAGLRAGPIRRSRK